MTKSAGGFMPELRVDVDSRPPIHRQVFIQLRDAIVEGSLPPNTRLASTRVIASHLGVARNSVLTAFAQLKTEGYLDARVGAGSFVTQTGPHSSGVKQPEGGIEHTRHQSTPRLSERGRRADGEPVVPDTARVGAFGLGVPALDLFPLKTWNRVVGRCVRSTHRGGLASGDVGGYQPLREAISAYLGLSRGVRCVPDQVLVLPSSVLGIGLCGRLLADHGDRVWMEEPGYPIARAALGNVGLELVPIPVDIAGLDVGSGRAACNGARLAYVTPSHQFPLGVTLSLRRRRALLEWAAEANSWIIEDDYDSEFRYLERPITALQGLDRNNRTLYLGTFSKVMFPSIRLAYLVVPPDLIEVFRKARSWADGYVPTLTQVAMADFIALGHFQSIIRRNRAAYHERHDALVEGALELLGDRCSVVSRGAGLHATFYLETEMNDIRIAASAAENGLSVDPLSRYFVGDSTRQGLVLGFGCVKPTEIRQALEILGRLLDNASLRRGAS